LRRGAYDIKKEPFFADIDWDKLVAKELIPPWVPPIKDARARRLEFRRLRRG
jgi:hypothetical protein